MLTAVIRTAAEREPRLHRHKWWGDYWGGIELERSFLRLGVATLPKERTAEADLMVLFYGRWLPEVQDHAAFNVAWVYSCAEALEPGLFEGFDHLLAGSQRVAEKLKRQGNGMDISVMYGATGKKPLPAMPRRYDVTFVGNRRGYGERPCILDVLRGGPLDFGFHVWGQRKRSFPTQYVEAEYLPHDECDQVFVQSGVNLNDHLRVATDHHLLPFRALDVPACGGLLLSLPNAGLDEFYGPGIAPQYQSPGHLRELIHHYLEDERARQATILSMQRVALQASMDVFARRCLQLMGVSI